MQVSTVAAIPVKENTHGHSDKMAIPKKPKNRVKKEECGYIITRDGFTCETLVPVGTQFCSDCDRRACGAFIPLSYKDQIRFDKWQLKRQIEEMREQITELSSSLEKLTTLVEKF